MTTTPQPHTDLDWEALRNSLWEPVRRPGRVEDRVLLRDTQQWLGSLPRGVRPVALPQKYARIANELARLWHDEAALHDYLEDLLVDRRGGRQGFPALVQEELRALCLFALRRSMAARDVRPQRPRAVAELALA